MHEKNTRYLLDTNVFIAAAKKGWTRTTELAIRLIDGPEDLLADEALIEVWTISEAMVRLL